jgi:HEPN domain-containing protein
MNLHNLCCWHKKKKVFTRTDCSESDLIQYSVDHLAAAEKLYGLSGRWIWEYLHSAAFLSHLSIELLLKACLLYFEDEFPGEHDLKRLFRLLRRNGIELSVPNKKWLNYLNRFSALRYPDPGMETEVDVNHWDATKSLFEELKTYAPREIQKMIVTHERYRSNVKSGKTIWPEPT